MPGGETLGLEPIPAEAEIVILPGSKSTIGDLAKWHAALFGGKVLKADSFKQMTMPGKLKDGSVIDMAPANPPLGAAANVRHDAYAFGLAVGTAEGETDIGHSGSIQG